VGWLRRTRFGPGRRCGDLGFRADGSHLLRQSDGRQFLALDLVLAICFGVTVIVSLLTSRSRKTDQELQGRVWGLTRKKEVVERAWYKKPWVLAALALGTTIVLNIIFF
jgi:hypothetical protein